MMEASQTIGRACERPGTAEMLATTRRTVRLIWIGGTVMFIALVGLRKHDRCREHPAGLATGITTLLGGGSLGLLLLVGPITQHIYTRAKHLVSHAEWEVSLPGQPPPSQAES